MADRQLTQEFVRSLFEYDPETGVLTWKERPVRATHARTDKGWNTKYAGRPAGVICEGYVSVGIFGVQHRAHRIAWVHATGDMPEGGIDHRDRDRSNNRLSNLRPATQAENVLNASKRSNNTSGATGVDWHVGTQKWRAKIRHRGKFHHLGLFMSIDEAQTAYRNAARRLFGDFAAK